MQAIAKKITTAQAALRSGDVTRARTIAKSVVKELAKIKTGEIAQDIILLMEAEANLLLGHKEQAEEALRKSIALNEKETLGVMRLAEIIFNSRERPQELFDVLAIGEAREPENVFWSKMRGIYYLQNNQSEEAVPHLSRAVTLTPQDHVLLDTLGVALQNIKKYDEATLFHVQAIELNPTEANYVKNLGVAMNKNGAPEAAVELFQRAIQLDPKAPEAYLNLGYVLDHLKLYDEAEKIYLDGIHQAPKFVSLYVNMANLYRETKRIDQAIEYYGKALKINPNHETAKFMLHTLSGETIETAPRQYIEGLFDHFSKNFEDKLIGDLSYRAPGVMHNMLMASSTLNWKDRSVRMLDLGCGTGLFGIVMCQHVGPMTGIDLSQGMLTKAAEKNLYHKLEHAEIVKYLEDLQPGEYDLIVAADVLIYVGALERVFELVAEKIKKPGLFTFSVERTDEPGKDYTLLSTARYAHSAEYLKRLIAQHGFIIEKFENEDIRRNLGEAIPGIMCVLRKE